MSGIEDIMKGAERGYDPATRTSSKGEKPRETYGMTKVAEMRDRLVKLAADVKAPVDGGHWLVASVALKRLEELANEIRTQAIIGDANAQYTAAMSSATTKTLVIDGATLKKYSYQSKYEYPGVIQALEERLKKEKKTAEADGSARLITRPSNPETDTLFTIAV